MYCGNVILIAVILNLFYFIKSVHYVTLFLKYLR